MKTIFNQEGRNEIVDRLNHVDGSNTPVWGQFTCENMLAHLADSMRMALGQLAVKPSNLPIRHWPLNRLVVYVLPIPKNGPTAPELIARPGESVEVEREANIRLLNELAEVLGRYEWPVHPAFGRLSEKAWGVLIYRHMDHHLRQFDA